MQDVKCMQTFSKLSQRDLVRQPLHTGSQAFNPFPCNDRSWSVQRDSYSRGQSFLPIQLNLSLERHLRALLPRLAFRALLCRGCLRSQATQLRHSFKSLENPCSKCISDGWIYQESSQISKSGRHIPLLHAWPLKAGFEHFRSANHEKCPYDQGQQKCNTAMDSITPVLHN